MAALLRGLLWLGIGSLLILGCPTSEDDDDAADDDTADDDAGDDDTGDDDTGDDDSGDDDTGDDDTGDDDTGDDDTAGPDADGDGYPDDEDCDPADPAVNPGAAELCGDAVDSDCDGDPDAGCATCDVTVPTDEATIQAAVDGSSTGQVICVEPGTYLENVVISHHEIDLVGLSGPHLTVIDGGGKGRVCDVQGDGKQATRLAGLTLTNGHVREGAGLMVDGGTASLSHLVVTGNVVQSINTTRGGGISLVNATVEATAVVVGNNAEAGEGGGIAIENATVTMRGCRIHDSLGGKGAGMWAKGSALTVEDSLFLDNYAEPIYGGYKGGGAYLENVTATLEGVEMTGNTAYSGGGLQVYGDCDVQLLRTEIRGNEAQRGGGLALKGAGTVRGGSIQDNTATHSGGGASFEDHTGTFESATIRGNQAAYHGGGIAIEGGAPVLRDLLVAENSAALSGGGAWFTDDAASLQHVVIAGNEATYGDGGGVWMEGSAAALANVAVLGNEAPGGIDGWGGGMFLSAASTPTLDHVVVGANIALHSGGLHLVDSSPVLRHVVVVGNAGDDGGGVAGEGKSTPDLQYCDVWGNYPGDFEGVADPTGTLGNVSVDPLWELVKAPEPWLWDLHLQPTSPLIDAGDPKVLDPDGSPADINYFGGPDAGGQDLDQDGSPLWWQPGPYDPKTYPGLGWDCDDLDPAVHAKTGC